MKFKKGDVVIVIQEDIDETGWIGPIIKFEGDFIYCDMSKYSIYDAPIPYTKDEIRKLTKLDKILK